MTKIRSTDASRIQDRRGQGGGGGGLRIPGLGGGGGLPFPTKAGGGVLGLIVLVAAVLLPKLLGGESGTTLSSPADESVPTGSAAACRTELEQTLCGASNDTQDYWARTFPTAFEREYQDTETVFFSGFTNTGCGQASSETGPFYCPLDNLVYFDLDFLVQLQEQFGATGDLAAQYIVAHEFGHHVQNLLGINTEMRRLQQQDPDRANEYSVALELQADCFAGAWVNDASSRPNLIAAGEVDEAVNAASAVGDDRIQQQTQGRVDPESFTHGTSQQRVDWFRRGFSTGDPNQCDTFAELG